MEKQPQPPQPERDPKFSFLSWEATEKKPDKKGGKKKGGKPEKAFETVDHGLQNMPVRDSVQAERREGLDVETREKQNFSMLKKLTEAIRLGEGQLRTRQSSVQRTLIRRSLAGYDIKSDLVAMKHQALKAAKNDVYLSQEVQKSLDKSMEKGVASVVQCIRQLEAAHAESEPQEGLSMYIGLNDVLDAGKEIDVVQVFLDESGEQPEADIRLIQVKTADKDKDSRRAHQQFVDGLYSREELMQRDPRLMSAKERRRNAERYQEMAASGPAREQLEASGDFLMALDDRLASGQGLPDRQEIEDMIPDRHFGTMRAYILGDKKALKAVVDEYVAEMGLSEESADRLRQAVPKIAKQYENAGITGADAVRMEDGPLRLARIRNIRTTDYAAASNTITDRPLSAPKGQDKAPVLIIK